MAYSKYRYFAIYNGDATEVFPIFKENPKLNYESDENIKDFIPALDEELVFIGDDYTYFLNIDQTDNCSLLGFEVYQTCDATDVLLWTGEFGTIDGKWDLDNCNFKVKPNTSNNVYECLLSGIEINIVNVEPVYTVTVDTRQYEACVTLGDLLTYVASQTCPDVSTIVSNFFQINPETPSAINYVTQETYDGFDGLYSNLYLTSLSNVRNLIPPSTIDLATVELLSFKDLMNDLKVLFNVEWIVTGETVRIEHVSYFGNLTGLDLTDAYYTKYMSGTNKYTYDRDKAPRYEKWTAFSSDQGCTITYDNACGKNKLNNNTVTYSTKKIFTDYYRAYSEPDRLAADSKGIFMFCTDPSREMLGITQNEELVLPRLVLKFHRYERPNQYGEFAYNVTAGDYTDNDYGSFFIYTETPLKLQSDVKIPLCCDVAFDPTKKITTDLGLGYVESAKLDLVKRELELSLKYKLNADNADIVPSDLTDLSVWYKSDAGVTESGGYVSQWDDQSGNARHLKPLNIADKPTFVSGGAIVFDDSVMLTDDSFITFPDENGTLFMVYYVDYSITGMTTDAIIATTSNFYAGTPHWDIGLDKLLFSSAGRIHSFTESVNYPANGYWNGNFYKWGNAQYQVLTMVKDQTDVSTAIFYNGKPPLNNKLTAFAPGGVAGRLVLGGSDVDKKFIGGISEFILYDRKLDDFERQKIELYLCKKYNLSMYDIS